MAYEVELKFPLDDSAGVRRELAALGAQSQGVHHEKDTYFAHPARSFAETDEALRVRQIGSRVFVTYKGPKIDLKTKTRTEIELEFRADRTGVSDVCQLWHCLGFRPVRELQKNRELFLVSWGGREVKACLDSVHDVGNFLELELSVEPAQLEESRQIIQALAQRLKLGQSERRSYLELLLEKDPPPADAPEKSEDWSE